MGNKVKGTKKKNTTFSMISSSMMQNVDPNNFKINEKLDKNILICYI